MGSNNTNYSVESDLALARANYERWFHNKVLGSIQDTRSLVNHGKVISEVQAIIYQAELKNLLAKPTTPPL
jgi:hypothetical protein